MRRSTAKVVLGVLAIAGIGNAVWRLTHARVPLVSGEEALFDDFGFTVIGPRHEKRGTAVYVRVENHAQRMDFQFRPETLAFYDGAGRRMRAQSQVGPSAALAPGDSFTWKYIFPPSAAPTEAGFDFHPVGNVVDHYLVGDRRYALR